MRVRTALYLDFDNIFGGMLAIDASAAYGVAQSPSEWLARLAVRHELDGPRTFLVRRCYMNPAGSMIDPTGGPRVYFSKFRPFFTRAGFEVIDCPSLTSQHKNAADIRIALDVVDALNAATRYDEFVIASSDADFTPLLQRLRAHDRRITLVSTQSVSIALAAMADQHLNEQQLIDLVNGEEPDNTEQEARANAAGLATVAVAPPADTFARFRALVNSEYATTTEPINLSGLAQRVRRELGEDVEQSNWFGAGSFGRALALLGLPEVNLSNHHVWDSTRHAAPAALEPAPKVVIQPAPKVVVPEVVARCCTITDLPRLASQDWPHVFAVLAECAATHSFSLSEATRWARDTLATREIDIGRGVFSFVVRGAMHGGCLLNSTPAPTAEQIGHAFLRNVMNRACEAGLQLDKGEIAELAGWLSLTSFHNDNNEDNELDG